MARRTTLALVPASTDPGSTTTASTYRVHGVLTTATGNRVVALTTRRRTTTPGPGTWPPDGRDAA
jgi:hypothetical protein